MTLESCVTTEKKPLLSVEEAQQRIYDAILPLTESEMLPLKQAFGRVLAETVFAPIDLPSARNAAMDGYAFSSESFATTLTNVGTSWAGKPFEGELNAGECVRIFTGAVLPENTDSVVMQEHVTVNGSQIEFPTNVKLKKNVREIGEDVSVGDALCSVNKILTAGDLGLLAAAGIENVSIIRQLKIVYFSTGDELVPLEASLTRGKIYDSNRYSLHGLLQNPCYQVTDGGVIIDDKDELKRTLMQAASEFDVIITTGGASVGDADYVKTVLEECGDVNFWKIAMKPGKPLAFGRIGACYFFGLPGNPVAVTTTFDIIVKSALVRLVGAIAQKPWLLSAVCTTPLKKSRGRQDYQRGILQQTEIGEFKVASTGHQGSHILSTANLANCYIILPSDCTDVEIGETVTVVLPSI
ncbi:MAG: molybdopterin molybdotransferase MoeA [Methylococcales bacterium]|nr:molybdopterin molybdotransferase MoeA [Methylococcales bacterium]MDD5754279.1 molybdopterin molybdotransferase MoeA [Methylococcales bacterium]